MGALKGTIRNTLETPDFQALIQLYADGKNVVRYLISCLYDADVLIKWRAIQALGLVSGHIGKYDPERIRRIIRDLLWSMNDESGSIIWNAPETMGEILLNNPPLIDEYGKLLVTNLYLEPFPKGVIWAMGRLGLVKPELLNDYIPDLVEFMGNSDPVIRGYSANALGVIIQDKKVPPCLRIAENDDQEIPVYDFETYNLIRMSIATLAVNAINRITKE